MNLHNTTLRRTVALLTLLSFVAITGNAQADIIISVGPAGPNPDENVLFQGAGHVAGPANTITGRTNSTSALVDFMSPSVIVGEGGQATVSGDTGPFTTITIIPQAGSFTFTDLTFNVDATEDGTITIDAFGLDGAIVVVETLLDAPLGENGQNFFRIKSILGQVVTSVALTASSDIINKLEQVRIGGVQFPGDGDGDGDGDGEGPTVVPEPSSIAVWSLMAILFCGYSYRRRR